MVAALTDDRTRDAALAATRSLRNAGLGVGALVATMTVVGGTGALRVLAAGTALAYLVAAALVSSIRLSHGPTAGLAGSRRAGLGSVGGLRRITVLAVANLPYALCFGVLEVVLPVLVTAHLHVSAAWSAGMFVGNTVLVVAAQVSVVGWLGRYSRRSVLALSGVVLAVSYAGFWAAGTLGGPAGAAAVAAVVVAYTAGEIIYTGSGTALVAATAPPHLLGRALTRWQLSTGVGQATAPAVLSALLVLGPATLWSVLAAGTLVAAAAVHRWAPADQRGSTLSAW
ncbi:hypothetical protein OG792_23620 [Micromonospora sp. NBC_01699]|uniref:hypothetical protein n=1 Tax=Micromonospora sp. NBC_01699 TaxID=2975984 RepID=UPI002E2CA790|nr:hypothetical protein [Micromonospora sp. NBC_01699]